MLVSRTWILVGILATICGSYASKGVVEDTFGTYEDPDTNQIHTVRRFTLENEYGMTVQVLNYGAIIWSINVPDKDGQLLDVALGWGNMSGYLGEYGRNPYFGATIGRVANRIAGARFELGGAEYQLERNNGNNHLHGGLRGFDKRIWAHTIGDSSVRFKYVSPDDEEGYPGEVAAQVTFELTPDNQLKLNYEATTGAPCPVALTNHNYFNLNGHKAANAKLQGHFIQLNADEYTPVDSELIPTGEMKDVEGSVYDLRTRKDLGALLASFPPGPNGYDENFCINQAQGEGLNFVARVDSEDSEIVLEVYSDQPGVQFYAGNQLPDPANGDPGLPAKDGALYFKHGAFALETQNYPNAINQPNFPSPVLNPGQVYRHATVYKFTSPWTPSAASLPSVSFKFGALLAAAMAALYSLA